MSLVSRFALFVSYNLPVAMSWLMLCHTFFPIYHMYLYSYAYACL